ncbi:MAG: haloalkane dehalogenase [Steroidobacteraceae bacterium]|jgi:pimeloyl-ACP methyl ester carboxylesterase|nr:haloalkane dehalogenase [Steroidobacteraceae bacterium]
MIEALRTPDERFAGIVGWPYAPLYREDLEGYPGLRMHYVDEGPRDARLVFVCLHGEPTWGYLYRRMLPVFAAAGHRVLVPDLFGFGRSDKPVDDRAYTFAFHRDALKRFLEAFDLDDICLVVQDWGGLLGLTLPMDYPDRIRRLVVMNTGLGIGRSPGPGFEAWRAYAAAHPDLDVAGLMRRSCPELSPEEAAAYAAPFPDIRFKAGVRRFPELVPTRPDMPGVETGLHALEFLSGEWDGETFMAIGLRDPVLGEPVMRALQRRIRGCAEPMLLPEAGHFVQEWGEPVARAALAHFGLAAEP